MIRREAASNPVLAAFLSFGLIVLIFADVVFMQAGISCTSYSAGMQLNLPTVSLYREPAHRMVYDQYYDAGGAIHQSDPMVHFMADCIARRQSPFWNPYSATGSPGPETLIDQKFSPVTLVTAALGGSDRWTHIVLLATYAQAVLFLLLTLRVSFGCTWTGAIAGAIVFMLNGFQIANLASNVNHAYQFFPLVLFAVTSFVRRPGSVRFVLAVLAHVPILATTFLPVTLLVLLTVHVAGVAFAVTRMPGRSSADIRRFCGLVVLQGATAVLALAMLAFLYVPIVDSFKIFGNLDDYGNRVFYAARVNNLISLFTPKHFWESYGALDPKLWDPAHPAAIGNVVFHFGITTLAVIFAALSLRARPRARLILLLSLATAACLARIFAVPGIAHLVDVLPALRSIGCQYWWSTVAVLIPLLAALSLTEITEEGPGRTLAIPYLVLLVCILLVGTRYMPPDAKLKYARNCFIKISVVCLASAGLVVALRREDARRRALAAAGIAAFMFVELTCSMNHMRYVRSDSFKKPPADIAFLKQSSGSMRVANYGPIGMIPEYGSAHQVQEIGSMIYPSMPRYAAFFRRAFVPDAKSRWEPFSCLILAKDEPAVNEALLDLLSVRYVVIPAGWTKHAEFFRSRGYPVAHQSTRVTIFTNEDAYPRAFVVPALVERAETPDMIPTSGRQVACTTDRQLIADAARFGIATRAPEAGAPAPTSRAEVVTYDHARVVIDIVGDKPGVLVLMDAWHPHWRASLDGSPCHLGVANEAFRGIAVPAGKHRVEMTYHRAGAGPSAVLLMLVGAALGTLLVMRRKVDGWLLSPASHD